MSCGYHASGCENGFELRLIKEKAEQTGDMLSAFIYHMASLFWLYHPYLWRDSTNEQEISCGVGLGWITEDQGNRIRQLLIVLAEGD